MNLINKVAVVTGAGSGLGRAAAQALVDGGAKVVVIDMNAEAGNTAVAELGESQARFIQLDVAPAVQWFLEIALHQTVP